VQESLLLRDTPHPIGETIAEMAAPYTAAPAFRLPPFFGAELQEGIWTPPVNVLETNDEIVLDVYLPGLNKSDLQIEIKNGSTLVIKGERRLQKDEVEHEGYLRKEFSFRRFFRSFALPLEIEPEGATALYRNGILEICLKKKAEAKKHSYRLNAMG